MLKEKSKVIRCQHNYKGKKCNVPLCVQQNDLLIVKRHGREIQLVLLDENQIKITCERCRNITFVKK